jgi:hypothetical protein
MVAVMTEARDIGTLFKDGAVIDAALASAAEAAVREARMLGRPLVVWQDGRVVELPPDQVPIGDTAPTAETLAPSG